jgi:predicted metal-dependent hydrolase
MDASRKTSPDPRRTVEQTRTLHLDGKQLRLVVRRSARRSLALTVDHRGARLAAPHGTPEAVITRFIHQHGDWLLARMAERQQPAPLALTDGTMFPLLGASARLRLGGNGRRALWHSAADGVEELCLPLRVNERTNDAANKALSAAVLRALKTRAAAWFQGRAAEYCQRLALAVPAVRLTAARTRWGSCSRTSGIRLHWRLIHLPPQLIDYVVAHEVAHLLEMNHSPRFWAVVGQLYPDWQSARRRLREAAARLPVIDGRDTTPISQEE